jgi:RNA polymerase sigma-70 factor, ECF subfamily
VFTEGYAPTTGAPVRTDLAAEAIRLAGQVAVLLPDEAEVHALLALMLLHDSRRTARVSPDGRLVPLEEQDRALWDRAQIERGLYELEASHRVADGAAGPYLLQASIAACHATARTPEETPWPMVAGLYEELAAIAPSPHVLLARAVAVGMAEGLDAGLAALAELGDSEPYGLRLAAEADLLRRYGHRAEAAEAYRAAAEHSEGAQREFLQGRHAELESE